MKWLKAIFLEVFGLFSDDGHFTVAILVWLALLWLACTSKRLQRSHNISFHAARSPRYGAHLQRAETRAWRSTLSISITIKPTNRITAQ